MSKLEKDTLEAVDELIESLAAARAEMRRAEQSLRQAKKRVLEGRATFDSFIVETQPSAKRKALLDALEAVNKSRHKARGKAFLLASSQGFTAADMARAWGISRQLADRYLKEATALSNSNHTAAENTQGPLTVPLQSETPRFGDGQSDVAPMLEGS